MVFDVGIRVSSDVLSSFTVVGLAGVPFEVGSKVGSVTVVASSSSPSSSIAVGVTGDGLLFVVGAEEGSEVLPIVGLLLDEGVGLTVGPSSSSLTTDGSLALVGFDEGSDVLPTVGLV